VPPAIERCVDRMLAKVRGNRPADAAAVAAALAELAVPDGPRRPRAVENQETTRIRKSRSEPASYVVHVQGGDAGPLAAALAPFALAATTLADGGAVVVLRHPAVTAHDAAAFALALRGALPDAAIAVTGASGGDAVAPLEQLLDTGADLLEAADLAAIFAAGPGGIRVDAVTAARLVDRYEVVSRAGAHYLVGEKETR
jgi:hypothetical protein